MRTARMALFLFAVFLTLGSCRKVKESAAEKEVDAYITRGISMCGDSAVVGRKNYGSEIIRELKDYSWKLDNSSITKAQRLNGVTHIVKFTEKYSAGRNLELHRRNVCWDSWYEQGEGEKKTFTKQNGKWDFDSGPLFIRFAPDCKVVSQFPDC